MLLTELTYEVAKCIKLDQDCVQRWD